MSLEDLYSDIILDYARNPQFQGEIDDATISEDGKNLSCGDEITLFLKVKNGKIEEARFKGHGCIVSQSSAALMCEAITGKSLDEAEKILEEVEKMAQGEDFDEELVGNLVVYSEISKFPVRVKCFTLAWHTLENALEEIEEG
ncbi:nitrogen fixation protein NifU [Marinitoga sp. 1135]|uniref:Fe-S cluster assembly sulfur transfer protein SufU n=1 Tax=unclassified Marinitoga TaxID=2640159 RepID=UPI0009503C0B|nr:MULTISPECIES: SUF system NifU family Fe-S cluster assembly protein [unclassified Marinitoga]APT76158.1 nitrogen fixation protein NifU [Marinitoga sp. 1137]NUU95910.1 nitrogen fixation protein NifU [Marinitoga sp. 1135]NUU97821.1 nitrogen fixation protein NifU [Marinitoga sp. 1138]